MTWGLTDAGFIAPRTADFLAELQADVETRLVEAGLSADIDWGSDNAYSILVAVMAARLGSVGEAMQALYDAFDRNNATRTALDRIGALVGVTREAAVASRATVTLSGTVGVTVPAGTQVRGGGTDGLAVWALSADVTIGSGGTVSGVVVCTETGPVSAGSGVIDEIVTPVFGLTSVTNPAAAAPGSDEESDASLRLSILQRVQATGSRSVLSIRAALLALDFVTSAVVVENDTVSAVSTGGITVPAHGVYVVTYPGSLTTAQRDEMALVLFGQVPTGIQMGGSDVAVTVSDPDRPGVTKAIAWDYGATASVAVAVVVTLETGYVLGDVEDAVAAAVEAYFATLVLGQTARILRVYEAVAGVEGVAGASVTLAGGGTDVVADFTEVLTASVSVTT